MVRVLGGKSGKLACERCGRPRYPGVPLCPRCHFGENFDPELYRKEKRRAKDYRRTGHRHTKGWYWNEDDPVGVKRNHLVRWLMKQGVPLDEARIIASRKYPR